MGTEAIITRLLELVQLPPADLERDPAVASALGGTV
jgi:hypothetical protein